MRSFNEFFCRIIDERKRLQQDAERFRRLDELLRACQIKYSLESDRVFIQGLILGPDRRVTYEG
jgi:hypothetical protein